MRVIPRCYGLVTVTCVTGTGIIQLMLDQLHRDEPYPHLWFAGSPRFFLKVSFVVSYAFFFLTCPSTLTHMPTLNP